MKIKIITLLSIMIIPGGYMYATAQDVASPVLSAPQQMEVTTATASMDVRAEDAPALIEQMKATAVAPESPVINTQGGSSPSAPSSSGYTIMLKPPDVVNTAPQFQFRDVTDRKLSTTPVLPMSRRSSAVESYRQSILKER